MDSSQKQYLNNKNSEKETPAKRTILTIQERDKSKKEASAKVQLRKGKYEKGEF